MIGRLRGTLAEKKAPWLIVELSSGLGYECEAPMSTFYRLPEVGEEVTLYTHQVVREDAQLLYAFFDQAERTLFRTLIKTNGVGPKLALTLLSGFEPQAFVDCINNDDVTSLTRVPGIGKKTAERLVVEMRGRLTTEGQASLPQSAVSLPVTSQSAEQEAISALIALGYKPQEASRTIAKLEVNELTTEEIIKMALQGVMA